MRDHQVYHRDIHHRNYLCSESYLNENHRGSFLRKEINPHPISGLLISPDKSFIQGKLIDPSRKYYISTNDYLLNGGDNMFFLKNNSKVYKLGYSLRDAFIDFTKTNLKLSSKIDNRFLKDE